MLSGPPNYQMSEYRNFGVLVKLQLWDPFFINQALRWAFNTFFFFKNRSYVVKQ